MTTQITDSITTTTDLVADLSLLEGSTYMLQNIGNSNLILLEGTSAPAADHKGHIIKPLCWWPFKVEVGGRLDVRTLPNHNTYAAISEATF